MSQHIDISSDKKVNKHRRGSNDTAKFPCRKKALGDNIEKQIFLDALKNVKAIQTFYIPFITLKLAKTGSP